MMKMLTICAMAGAILAVGAASGSAATITVIRGDQVERIDTARGQRTPHIVRGLAESDDRKDAPTLAPRQGLETIAAGETLWLRDIETGHVIACSVWSSGIVGRDALRCTGTRF